MLFWPTVLRGRPGRPHSAVSNANCLLSSFSPEGRDDERALYDLRGLIQKGFGPIPWGFGGKWCQQTSALARQLVLLTPVDVEKVQHGLIFHTGMLAHPRVITNLLNRLSPEERQHLRQLCRRTYSPRHPHTQDVAMAPQPRVPVVRQVSLHPTRMSTRIDLLE